MLKSAMLFAVSSIVMIAFAPTFLPLLKPDAPPEPAPAAKASPPSASPAPVVYEAPSPRPGDREVSFAADPRGQYFADVLLNGVPVHMMIDTGATYVTLSADTADRLGLRPLPGEPQGMARTANGDVELTPAMLSTVAIGSIYMTDVRAFVLDRHAGDLNLVGTNFLKRLASVEQRNGRLYLRQ